MERPWSPGSPGRPAIGDALAQRKRRANLQKQMKLARDAHAEKIEVDTRESVFNPTPGGQTLRPLWRPSTANGPWEKERGRIEVSSRVPSSSGLPLLLRSASLTNCMEQLTEGGGHLGQVPELGEDVGITAIQGGNEAHRFFFQ